MPRLDPEDVMLRVLHNHGEVEVPLKVWMEIGPGARRFTAPFAAYHRLTGKPVGLRQIPLAYRNNRLSRALIRLGLLQDPWPRPDMNADAWESRATMQTEIFALCGSRSVRIVESFRREYLSKMQVGQEDFLFPHLAAQHTHSFASVDELLEHLLRSERAEYHLYWSDSSGNHASLYFLEDGGLIANLARYAIPEDEQRSMLARLVEVVEAQAGYTDVEGLPPDTSSEFLACAARAPIAYRKG